MGWGTWAGIGEAFTNAGSELGPKRTEAKYRREEAERAQTAEQRQEAEERRRQQLFPGQLKTQTLTNTGLETQNARDELERAIKKLELEGYPAEQARKIAIHEAQLRERNLQSTVHETTLAEAPARFKMEQDTTAANIRQSDAGVASSGAAARASDVTSRVREEELKGMQRANLPEELALKDIEVDRREFDRDRAALKLLEDEIRAEPSKMKRQAARVTADTLKNKIRGNRISMIDRFKSALVRYQGGPIQGNHKRYDDWFTDIDYVSPVVKDPNPTGQPVPPPAAGTAAPAPRKGQPPPGLSGLPGVKG